MVSPKNKALYYAQLSRMVESGLTLIEAFSALDSRSMGGELRAATRRLNSGLIEGESFLELIEKERAAFSPFEVRLISIGVEGGSLGSQLQLLEEWFTKVQRFHWQVRRELMFPFFLLIFAYLVVNARLFIIDGPLVFFWEALYPLLAVLAGVLVLYLLLDWKYGEAGIEQGVGIHVPFLRGPIRKLLIARFLRALASLLEAGLPFFQTLDLALESVGGGFLKKPVNGIITSMESGVPFEKALSSCSIFPHMIRQLLITGEKSGSLTSMAQKGATLLEDEAELKLREVFKIFSLLFYLSVVAYIVYEVFIYWSAYVEQITESS